MSETSYVNFTRLPLTPTGTQTQDSTQDWGYVHILGGDDFIENIDGNAGQRGGGYKNDVWMTEGSDWEIYNEGSKPMALCTMQWKEINPGRLPPADLTYEEWIICQARRGGGGGVQEGAEHSAVPYNA